MYLHLPRISPPDICWVPVLLILNNDRKVAVLDPSSYSRPPLMGQVSFLVVSDEVMVIQSIHMYVGLLLVTVLYTGMFNTTTSLVGMFIDTGWIPSFVLVLCADIIYYC